MTLIVVAVVVVAAGVLCENTNTKTRKHEHSHRFVCERIYLHGVNVGLAFAGLRALRPAMTNVFVAGTATVLIPSAAESTATDSPGFLERATLWTNYRISDR